VEKDQKSSVQVMKLKTPPTWVGTNFECWKEDVTHWAANNKDDPYNKCQDLLESLKKNPVVKQYLIDVLIDGTKAGEDRMVEKILDLMNDRFAKTQPEHLKDLFDKMRKLEMGQEETCEEFWDRFYAIIVEMDKEHVEEHLMYLMSTVFVDSCVKAWVVSPEEQIHLKESLERVVPDTNVRVPVNKGLVIKALNQTFVSLKIENNRSMMSMAPIDTNYNDNRSRYDAWKEFERRPDFNKYQRSLSQKGFYRTQSGQYRKASCLPPGHFDRS
jgi:hypothetical protein